MYIRNLYELETEMKCQINEYTTGLTQTFNFGDSFLHILGYEPLKSMQ